jgi:hypothetical protein
MTVVLCKLQVVSSLQAQCLIDETHFQHAYAFLPSSTINLQANTVRQCRPLFLCSLRCTQIHHMPIQLRFKVSNTSLGQDTFVDQDNRIARHYVDNVRQNLHGLLFRPIVQNHADVVCFCALDDVGLRREEVVPDFYNTGSTSTALSTTCGRSSRTSLPFSSGYFSPNLRT